MPEDPVERKFPVERGLHGIINGFKKDSLTHFRRKKCNDYTYFRCNFCLKMICLNIPGSVVLPQISVFCL